jgi:hypothetical protein
MFGCFVIDLTRYVPCYYSTLLLYTLIYLIIETNQMEVRPVRLACLRDQCIKRKEMHGGNYGFLPQARRRLNHADDQDTRKPKRARLNDLKTSDSIPPPPKLPHLPPELVEQIVSHLKDDKHSLAQWMRVSSHYNRVAAPQLYREFTLKSPRIQNHITIAQPDGTPFYTSNLAEKGIIPSKERNMQHAQTVLIPGRFN